MEDWEVVQHKTPEEYDVGRSLRATYEDARWNARNRLLPPPGAGEAETSARAALDKHLAQVRARVESQTPDQRYDSAVERNYGYMHEPVQLSMQVLHRDEFMGTNRNPGREEFREPAEDALKSRPRKQGRQMSLSEISNHPSFEPKDHVIHEIRQENPAMNDYDFHLDRSFDRYSDSQVVAEHKENPGHTVGKLQWHGSEDNYGDYGDDGEGCYCGDSDCEGSNYGGGDSTAREISWAGVHKEHRGKGLGTALFDIASKHPEFEGNTPVHSSNRSAAGYGWSKYVGGDEYERTEGHGSKEY